MIFLASAHNRIASHVDLKASDDTHDVNTVSPAVIRVRNIKKGKLAMTRQLISVRQLIQDLQEEGLDIDQVFVDPDDVVEVEQEAEEEEE